MRYTLRAVFSTAALASLASAQPSSSSPLSPPANGPRRGDSTWTAITDCTIHVSPTQSHTKSTIVFRDGRITAVLPAAPGADGELGTDDDIAPPTPIGPRVIKGTDLHAYAAFIDPYVEIDASAAKPRENDAGTHWNPAVTPQRKASAVGISAGSAKELRDIGFGAAAISPAGGVFRGISALTSLREKDDDASAQLPELYKDSVYSTVAFEAGQGYPSSQMGAIALIRQTLSDAKWHADASANVSPGAPKSALDALGPTGPGTLLFNTDDELESIRAAKIAKEFSRSAMLLGCGTEFARLDAIAQARLPVLLPVNFPKAPDVSSPGKIDATELRDMMTWEQAPTNPRRLRDKGIVFAFTTAKLKSKGDFMGNVRKAILHGLSKEHALEALTVTPASLLGLSGELGTLETGKRANIILATGDIFDKKTKLRTVFVDGKAHELDREKTSLEGTWDIDVPGFPSMDRRLVIDADNAITMHRADKNVKCTKVTVEKNTVSFIFDHEKLNANDDAPKGVFISSAAIQRDDNGQPVRLSGTAVSDTGDRFAWSAAKRPASLAGDWAVIFKTDNVERQNGPIVRIAEKAEGEGAGRTLTTTVEVRAFDDAGKHEATQAEVVSRDGSSMEYDVANSKVAIALDPKAKPAMLTGSVTTPAGEWPFTARKIDDPEKWWIGTWVVVRMDGKVENLDDPNEDKVRLAFAEKSLKITFTNPGKPDIVIDADDLKIEDGTITFTYSLKAFEMQGVSKDSIIRKGAELVGTGEMPDGSKHTYVLRLEDKKADEEEKAPSDIPESLPIPFGPYGLFEPAKETPVLIQNANLWTNTDGGIFAGWLLIRDGKISAMGKDAAPADIATSITNIRVLDAQGRHVTPGIIDAHSHTGIARGVNEGGQAITAEVRIQDVTNPDDVNWYRQLAGGVTSVLSLHGSANAIGGQSQVNKLRWGCASPDDMHFEGAPPGIKFALGENPRQINWSAGGDRYPATRMGVETLIRDRFTAAKEYASNPNARRDLELEALAEILAGKRLIHCHSYRQDEILMLGEVAKDFGFTIGTYQHILEGYKVAEVVRDRAGGGSGFADWWAYKAEVQDAIPQAFVIMHKVGAVASYNSDSNELARRLNTEAAKAVKYGRDVGGLAEEDALKFVTLNPAKQLKIDSAVGTLERGKVADIVVWDQSPLSSYAKATHTFVDGKELFSLEQDAQHRQFIAQERARLIQKLLKEGEKPKDAKPNPAGESSPGQRRRRPTEEELEQLMLLHEQQHMSGKDPRLAPGVCGCGFSHAFE